MNALHDEDAEPDDDYVLPPVYRMNREEARQLFDENARYWLDMSGDEFLRKWRNREFGDVDSHPNHLRIMNVAMLLPFAEDDVEERAEQLRRMEFRTMNARSRESIDIDDLTETNATPQPHYLTHDEALALFDQRAHELLGMSGAEFKRKWETGEIKDPDRSEVLQVWMLLPWAE